MLDGNHYVNCSRYAMQLDQYLEHFPAGQILVVPAEDLARRRREALRRIFAFLGVDGTFDCAAYDRVLNTASERRRKNLLGRALTACARRFDASAIAVRGDLRARPLARAYVAVAARPVPRPVLSDERRRELARFLENDVRRLRELTGLALEEWGI